MLRPLLVGVLLAAVGPAAPVPKGMKSPKTIKLTRPRPLMIRTATVEEGEVKLVRDGDDREPRTARLRDVIATDRDGRPLTGSALAERLKKPTAVIVVPCPLAKRAATALGEEDAEPTQVDTGDEWRKVLSASAVVIDGEAFDLDWEYGRYDLQVAPGRVEDGDALVTALSVPFFWRTERWKVEENLIWREKDQKAADEFAAGITARGVVVYHRAEQLPKEHRSLFGDELPFVHNDGVKRFKMQRIHGGIM